jgi:tRNA A37 methylthiotransferase MiaB
MERRASSLVGRQFEVLAERFDLAEGAWISRSKREAPEIDGEIRVATERRHEVGDYVDVTITGSHGVDLTAEPLAG